MIYFSKGLYFLLVEKEDRQWLFYNLYGRESLGPDDRHRRSEHHITNSPLELFRSHSLFRIELCDGPMKLWCIPLIL